MKIFIDGSAGTTGLRIHERLGKRSDLSLVTLGEAERKDASARREALNRADVVFLCLPDDAAREAVSMVENPDTVILDTSTAHRTADGWAYGFPELSAAHRERVTHSRRIAVPGCHASGFIALVYPLVEAGILAPSVPLSCFSLTGYSGGGKKMIAAYESSDRDPLLGAPRIYGLSQVHKHLPEMKAVTGLDSPPVFCPTVADFYSGMLVTVPLSASLLAPGKTADDVRAALSAKYLGEIVRYCEDADEAGFLSAAALSGKDSMEISVFGNDERILLAARYDNLGKGASGAAVECLNLLLGAWETTGLVL